FPITTSHPHSEQAAEAAEAAGAQGKFWEMHDHLYEHQQRLTDPDLHGYAEELGLDVERFDRDLAGHVHTDRVREDFMRGVRAASTPSASSARRYGSGRGLYAPAASAVATTSKGTPTRAAACRPTSSEQLVTTPIFEVARSWARTAGASGHDSSSLSRATRD